MDNLQLRQLFDKETSTYTYLLYHPQSKEALIIDPVKENADRDLLLIKELDLNLKYILETHLHADHITGAAIIKDKTKAQVGISANANVLEADLQLAQGKTLGLGGHQILCLDTPGHTNTCMCYFTTHFVFTGDTLFIRGCGRTDFQSGNSQELFKSVREKLFTLPEQTFVYPGHDYNGKTCSTIYEEKQFNPRLSMDKTEQEFVDIMDNLNLPRPKKMDEAVPANLKLGA